MEFVEGNNTYLHQQPTYVLQKYCQNYAGNVFGTFRLNWQCHSALLNNLNFSLRYFSYNILQFECLKVTLSEIYTWEKNTTTLLYFHIL